VSALNIGTYKVRSQVLRGYVRRPRPASPGSTTKVEACHPRVQLCGEPLGLSGPSLHCLFTLPCQRATANSHSRSGQHGRYAGIRMPPWALAVAETHPRGLTGRVGAGQRPGLPRDEARFSSRRLGRNPPSGTQSLDKTPLGNRMVARSEKNWTSFFAPANGGPDPARKGRSAAGGGAQENTARQRAAGRNPKTGGQRPGAERKKTPPANARRAATRRPAVSGRGRSARSWPPTAWPTPGVTR